MHGRATSLVDLIKQLHVSVPGLELSISDAKSQEIVALIVQDKIDVGLVAWPHYPDAVSADLLHAERYAVAMREGDVLSKGSVVDLEQLAGQPYIDRLGCEFDDFFAARHGAWTLEVNTVFASEREDWIQGLLLAGLGYAIVPEYMQLPAGLVTRPLARPEVSRDVAIITLRGKQLSPASAMFVRLAKSNRWHTPPIAKAE